MTIYWRSWTCYLLAAGLILAGCQTLQPGVSEAPEAAPAPAEPARGDLPRLVLQQETRAGKVLQFAPVSLSLGETSSLAPTPATPAPAAVPPPSAQEKTPVSAKKEPPYRLSPGDVLDVQCFSDPTMSRERTVRFDGCISLPIIQDVTVNGLTLVEAESRIRAALRNTFREPQISVTLKSAVRRSCTILGNVAAPGRYACAAPMPLRSILEQAGGFRAPAPKEAGNAWLHKAIIVRTATEEAQNPVICCGLENEIALDTRIVPGDLVIVAEPVYLVYVLDPASGPAAVEGRPGMSLAEALAATGLLQSGKAPWQSVELWRDREGALSRIARVASVTNSSAAEVPALEPGDVLQVQRKGIAPAAPASLDALRQRAAEAFYAEGLGVREFAWLAPGAGKGGTEASGRLDASMANLVKLLSGTP